MFAHQSRQFEPAKDDTSGGAADATPHDPTVSAPSVVPPDPAKSADPTAASTSTSPAPDKSVSVGNSQVIEAFGGEWQYSDNPPTVMLMHSYKGATATLPIQLKKDYDGETADERLEAFLEDLSQTAYGLDPAQVITPARLIRIGAIDTKLHDTLLQLGTPLDGSGAQFEPKLSIEVKAPAISEKRSAFGAEWQYNAEKGELLELTVRDGKKFTHYSIGVSHPRPAETWDKKLENILEHISQSITGKPLSEGSKETHAKGSDITDDLVTVLSDIGPNVLIHGTKLGIVKSLAPAENATSSSAVPAPATTTSAPVAAGSGSSAPTSGTGTGASSPASAATPGAASPGATAGTGTSAGSAPALLPPTTTGAGGSGTGPGTGTGTGAAPSSGPTVAVGAARKVNSYWDGLSSVPSNNIVSGPDHIAKLRDVKGAHAELHQREDGHWYLSLKDGSAELIFRLIDSGGKLKADTVTEVDAVLQRIERDASVLRLFNGGKLQPSSAILELLNDKEHGKVQIACISNCTIEDMRLNGVDLRGVTFHKVNANKVDFQGALLQAAEFMGCTLDKCWFQNAHLAGAKFGTEKDTPSANCKITFSSFRGAHGDEGTHFNYSMLKGSHFVELQGFELKSTILSDATRNRDFRRVLQDLDQMIFDERSVGRGSYKLLSHETISKSFDTAHKDWYKVMGDLSNAKLMDKIYRSPANPNRALDKREEDRVNEGVKNRKSQFRDAEYEAMLSRYPTSDDLFYGRVVTLKVTVAPNRSCRIQEYVNGRLNGENSDLPNYYAANLIEDWFRGHKIPPHPGRGGGPRSIGPVIPPAASATATATAGAPGGIPGTGPSTASATPPSGAAAAAASPTSSAASASATGATGTSGAAAPTTIKAAPPPPSVMSTAATSGATTDVAKAEKKEEEEEPTITGSAAVTTSKKDEEKDASKEVASDGTTAPEEKAPAGVSLPDLDEPSHEVEVAAGLEPTKPTGIAMIVGKAGTQYEVTRNITCEGKEPEVTVLEKGTLDEIISAFGDASNDRLAPISNGALSESYTFRKREENGEWVECQDPRYPPKA